MPLEDALAPLTFLSLALRREDYSLSSKHPVCRLGRNPTQSKGDKCQIQAEMLSSILHLVI